MSAVSDLILLVPEALELVRMLVSGDEGGAERKAKALAQSIALKRLTREAAKAGR